MNYRGRVAFGALLAVLAGLAVACGGDDKSSTSASSTAAPAATAASSPTSGAAGPRSLDEWEALWSKQRDAIVKRIKDNHWGTSADGKTATGPEGFTIDLTKCPSGWSNTEGLTDTSIKIGYPLPQSGVAAESGGSGQGAGRADEVLRRQGGVQGLHRQDPIGRRSRRATTATTRPARSPSSTS